jgi:hypothetical protein
MTMYTALLLVVAALFPGAGSAPPPAETIPLSAKGKELAAALDAMDVKNRWLPTRHVSNWKTGEADDKKGGPRTHCSLFVSAACWKLHVPMLDPPPQTLLANRQQAWLQKEGKKKGWRQVSDPVEAQRLANQGVVVVASYRNPNPKRAGHIAVVRPAAVDAAGVRKTGPRVTQSGGTNYTNASVKTGFRNHPGAWEHGEVLFFAYKAGSDR